MLYLGCSGFQYEDWLERFYPRGLEEPKFLLYYYHFFNSVEIDSTYYSFPGEKTVNSWINKMKDKDDFLFSVKFPREVTHDEKGITERSIEIAQDFVKKVIKPLQDANRMGSGLLQLSPFLDPAKDNDLLGKLWNLMSSIHSDYRLSLEIRNKNFLREDIFSELLRILKEAAVALVSVDSPGLPYFYHQTAPFSYVRFHGRNADLWFGKGELNGRLNKYDYLYSEDELTPWAERVRNMEGDIFIYFNNHAQAKAAINAIEFERMLGMKIVRKEQQTNLDAF
ncbi:MAG: DUF72 domain-containing protein [Thermoplasmatales archaeon]